MRFFISFTDHTATKRTTRITIENCTSTSVLIKEICKEIRMPKTQVIIKLKNQPHNLRLIQNWPLNNYYIKNGSIFIVDFIQIQHPEEVVVLDKIEEEIDDCDEEMSSSSISSRNELNESDYIASFQQDLQQALNAVRGGQLDMLSMILKKEAVVENEKYYERIMNKKLVYVLNEAGDCGRNALHWAIHSNNPDMVSFLIIKGANPTIITIDEYSPLQLAILHRSPIIINLLLQQKKIDINQVTKNGSALHLAVINQDKKGLQILLKHEDIDIEVLNYKGKTPLDLCNNEKIKQLLMKKAEMKKMPIPNISKGTINRVSSTWYRLKERNLVINPFKNTFTIYELSNNIQDQQNLTNIHSIQKIQQKSMMMNDNIHYFKLIMKEDNKEYLFALKNVKIYKKWIDSFREAMRFIEFSLFIKEIPSSQQIITFLNDDKNQITFHRRKTETVVKKTLSIMNLKAVNLQDEMQERENSGRKSKKLKETNDNSSIVSSQDYKESEIMLGSILQIGSISSSASLSHSNYSFEKSSNTHFDSSSPMQFRKNSEHRYQTVSEFKAVKDSVSYDDFVVKRQLGNGAFGHVYLVQYKANQKYYALKVLNKKKLIMKKHLKYAVGQANILKKVTSPFIIKLYFAFQTPSNIYMVLDNCSSGDLSELICTRQHLSENTARFIIAQLILAVEYLHRNKILYRDLKPQNILIGSDGYIRLTDFGLSRQNSFSMSFCGSPAYLSPEMLDKKGVGFSSDIYGIGCVLYEMVIGMPPYFDESIEVLYQNIKSGKLRFPSHLSIEIKSLISKLLERDLTKRIGINNFNQIKTHDFFKKFDWSDLQRKKMKIPREVFDNETNDNFFQSINLQGSNPVKLVDNDYNQSTKMINRIKNFTFIREEE